MEFWDIYDENKKPTGRTMKRNDWCLKDGEYHLTVLGSLTVEYKKKCSQALWYLLFLCQLFCFIL